MNTVYSWCLLGFVELALDVSITLHAQKNSCGLVANDACASTRSTSIMPPVSLHSSQRRYAANGAGRSSSKHRNLVAVSADSHAATPTITKA